MDADKLIKLVEAQPCLWDKSCELYKNRQDKEKAWVHVAEDFIINWEQKSNQEKTAALTDIKSKWRNMRDSFKRQLNQGKKRKYVYADALEFLKHLLLKRRDSINNEDDDEPLPMQHNSLREDCPPDSPASSVSKKSETPKPRRSQPKRQKLLSATTYCSALLKKLDAPLILPPREPDDPQKMYLLSLLPNYRELLPEEKLEFQVMVSNFFMEKIQQKKLRNDGDRRTASPSSLDLVTIKEESSLT